MFENIQKFFGYWYFRYLLVTELYMVEKWERVMIHIVFFIIFSIISLVNNYVVLNLVSFFIQSVLHPASNLTIVRELPDPETLFETEL